MTTPPSGVTLPPVQQPPKPSPKGTLRRVPPPKKSFGEAVIVPPLAAASITGIYMPINTTVHAGQTLNIGPFKTVQTLYRQGGPLAFYRGFGPAAVNAALSKGVSFGVYAAICRTRPPEEQTPAFKVAAGFGGVLVKIGTCLPLDNVKILLQVAHQKPETSHIKTPQDAYRFLTQNGAKGLYKTAPIATVKSTVAHVPYLVVQDSVRGNPIVKNETLNNLIAGFLGGIATIPLALPADHLKTNCLTRPELKHLSSKEAIATYLKQSVSEVGVIPTVLRLYVSSPAAAVQIIVGGTSMSLALHLTSKLYKSLEGMPKNGPGSSRA